LNAMYSEPITTIAINKYKIIFLFPFDIKVLAE
jgi:hypothetical protein